MSNGEAMGGPAFPCAITHSDDEFSYDEQFQGMTLWDYYAAHTPDDFIRSHRKYGTSTACRMYADAMLTERKKAQKG